jgi:hypothetical protein
MNRGFDNVDGLGLRGRSIGGVALGGLPLAVS